ncbi:MAG: hypothetical protein HRT51_06675 [Colwellia sp.]|nr:hypothetical protein [Colwellia sp.]
MFKSKILVFNFATLVSISAFADIAIMPMIHFMGLKQSEYSRTAALSVPSKLLSPMKLSLMKLNNRYWSKL